MVVGRSKSKAQPTVKTIFRHIRKMLRRLVYFIFPEFRAFEEPIALEMLKAHTSNSIVSSKARVLAPCSITNSAIGDYTYLARGAVLNRTTIGRFCSIGPNLFCGWGIHPVDGLSTSPMFYSTLKQNGVSLCSLDKIQETKPITIGNDVFIGMNVTILDGVRIGDGAVVGAGTVVSKDVPPFAVAYGNPIQVARYRFDEATQDALQRIRWWDPEFESLSDIERFFFDLPGFIRKHDPSASPPFNR